MKPEIHATGDNLTPSLKRVLLVVFDFPPRRTSGVYRPSAFTKYLPQFGWQPTVLTVRDRGEGAHDSSLLERIPAGARVVRTRYLRVDAWERSTAKALRSTGALRAASTDARQAAWERAVRSLGRWIWAFLYFPDRAVGWIPFGLARAIQLHFQQKFNVVYTSSFPFSTAIIGLMLKALVGIPWVVEFRDPWLPPPDREDELRVKRGEGIPPLRRKLERKLYRFVLRRADLVVAVTKGHAEELQRVDGVPFEKVAVVSNGFDEADFQNHDTPRSDLLDPDYLHVTHLGDVYPSFTGKFFPALAEVASERPDLVDRLRINIIGSPDEETRRYASTSELQRIVRLHEFVSHDKAIEAMRLSHRLLLFYSDPLVSRLCVPGKLYEYLRVGRPILALAYEGGVKELISKGRAGSVIQPDNMDAIKQALTKLLSESETHDSARPSQREFAAQFRYERLTNNLAMVLEGVARNGR